MPEIVIGQRGRDAGLAEERVARRKAEPGHVGDERHLRVIEHRLGEHHAASAHFRPSAERRYDGDERCCGIGRDGDISAVGPRHRSAGPGPQQRCSASKNRGTGENADRHPRKPHQGQDRQCERAEHGPPCDRRHRRRDCPLGDKPAAQGQPHQGAQRERREGAEQYILKERHLRQNSRSSPAFFAVTFNLSRDSGEPLPVA